MTAAVDPRPATRPASPPSLGGPAGSAPPAWVPLGFLAASGVGLVLFGIAAALGADHLASPTHPGMVSAVHAGMLGFLTTGVLGSLHQFAPVVGGRPLRSTAAAGITLVTLQLGLWTLAGGFAHGPSWLVPAGGSTATAAVLLAAWNLSGPLSARGKGIPLVGLRLSVAFLVTTVAFGIVYAFDRNEGWFPLLPHRVLAHAHIGLIGWLGLAYVAVAEKLWPMFLLAHRPRARSGTVAVALLGVGVPVLATGLLLAWPSVATGGGALVLAGLVGHLVSLVQTIRARRRRVELLHAFIASSAAFLVMAMGMGATAGLAPVEAGWRSRLVVGEVLALVAWLGIALLGHAHKVVPFIVWSDLRARGRIGGAGPPLLFADLYRHPTARATLALAAGGFGVALVGALSLSSGLFAGGMVAVGAAGATATWNLGSGPRRALRLRDGQLRDG